MKPVTRIVIVILVAIFLVVAGIAVYTYKGDKVDKVVEINSGKIVGEEHDEFYAYRGVPYAEPPIGDLRFAPPQPFAQKWDDTREFKKISARCSQYTHFGYEFSGSEDCLYLNVFVPKAVAKSNEKVPVIVFFHGGAFMFGSSNGYGPEILMKSENMILVTVNYRLGVLGFLSTEDEVIPGNFGLKDQAEALRWVQRNIGAFNGDSKKVTISGFSAGGASVQLHYMSQLTDGLFNNGISHSGVALNPWVMMENEKEKTHQIASFMNCSGNHEEMLTCLREKPAEDLVMLEKHFQPFLYNPFSPFGVVVEPLSDTAFLTDHPLNILKSGNFKKLPWIVSQVQDEGLHTAAEFYYDETLKKINDQWDELAPFLLDYNGTTSDSVNKLYVSRKIRQDYLGNAAISKENFARLRDIFTDRLFKHGAFKAAQLQSAFAPTYFYHFRFIDRTDSSTTFTNSTDFIGVSHGRDIHLMYGSSVRKVPFSEDESEVSDNLVKLYYNFAKNNQAIYGYDHIDEVTPERVNCLEIASSDTMVQLNESFGKVAFWDEMGQILDSRS